MQKNPNNMETKGPRLVDKIIKIINNKTTTICSLF